jgi:amidase
MRINHRASLLSSPLISLLVLSGFVNAIDGWQFTITEATIDDIQRAFTTNELTSRQLVDLYLGQIASLNPLLRGVLEVNPDARDQADQADRERKEAANHRRRRALGELHGIPVLLKDSIATEDALNTTCGSYALLGSKVPRDSGVVERLRRAGAVILGKATQNEWYGIRSTTIPEGWCARGGQGVVSIAFFSFFFFFDMSKHGVSIAFLSY